VRRDAKTATPAEPNPRQNTRLEQLSGEGGKDQRGSLGQDSNGFSDSWLREEPHITISVIEGPSKGLVYEMREPCITLGRVGGGADFQVNEPEASEVQCIVAARQYGVCLYDAVSIHGTYVNNQRIAAAELTDMSTFRVGSSLLLVKIYPNPMLGIC
jgi:pSer/pThr/pTyr-binding forkhead associated (FHA) protein